MTAKRNVDGLKQNAQKKRQSTFERVEKGIQQLIKEKKQINFNTVAAASGVSKAWLYREPEIKARIEKLRLQETGKKQTAPRDRASDPAKNALIKTLQGRVKTLEKENYDLRRQNETAYGHVLKVMELEKQIERLKAENERLRQSQSNQPSPASINAVLSNDLETTLDGLGVNLNSTLMKLIQDTPEGIVETAIEALKEATKNGRVINPGGFLNRAISDAWQPCQADQEKADLQDFNQWWKWAYKQGLVKAATQFDGVQHVLTKDEEWMPFQEMLERHPIPN